MFTSAAGRKYRPKMRKNRPNTDHFFPKIQTKYRPLFAKIQTKVKFSQYTRIQASSYYSNRLSSSDGSQVSLYTQSTLALPLKRDTQDLQTADICTNTHTETVVTLRWPSLHAHNKDFFE